MMRPADRSETIENPEVVDESISRPGVYNLAAWDFAGRVAALGVSFVVGVILTRLLAPEEFGIFGIAMAIVLFSNIFLDFGFRAAIIQAKEIDQRQLSTVFFINLAIAATIFILVVLNSENIASFYESPGLALPIVTMSALFIINAANVVPQTLLSKEMRFKALSITTIIAAVGSGTIGTVSAITGLGIWALVAQSVSLSLFSLVGMAAAAGWRPSWVFDLASIRPLRKLSASTFGLTLLDEIYNRLDVFMVGKVYDMSVLGFYNRAQSVNGLVRNFSVGTLGAIVLPFFSRIQDDVDKLRSYYRRSTHLVLFVTLFVSGILFLTARDIIVILFTERWESVASYFRLMAVASFGYPVSVIMVNIIIARGNARDFFKMEMVKRALLAPGYLVLVFGSILQFLSVLILLTFLTVTVNAHFLEKEIGVKKKETLGMIMRYASAAVVGAAVGTFISTSYEFSIYVHLALMLCTFSFIYFGAAYALRFPGLIELLEKFRRRKPAEAGHSNA